MPLSNTLKHANFSLWPASSEGGYVAAPVGSGTFITIANTSLITSGQLRYCEFSFRYVSNDITDYFVGIASASALTTASYVNVHNQTGAYMYRNNATMYDDGSSGAYGSSWVADETNYDVIRCWVDRSNNYIYFGENATINGTPTSGSSGTGAAASITDQDYYFVIQTNNLGRPCVFHGKESQFEYSLSSGYSAIDPADGGGGASYAIGGAKGAHRGVA